MIGKIDWTAYLHRIRKREINIVFSLLPKREFLSGFEIGAGDGYQTTLLARRVGRLISSDLNFKRIKIRVSNVEYKELDADALEGVFQPGFFDFIFSSNVLEHVRDPLAVLKSTHTMLRENGYAVHIVPNRWMKVFYILFFYPNLLLLVLDRIIGKFRGKKIFQGEKINLENNINKEKTNRWKRLLLPTPHGNYPGHWREFAAFGRSAWEQKFAEAGFSAAYYAKGPAFSGYGFGLDFLRSIAESLGVSSEHIFIIRKMPQFERDAWDYTRRYLPHGSFRDQKKFVGDWLKKEKNAKAFLNDFRRDVGDPIGKKVLDIGFGNGIIMKEFLAAGADIYGVEVEGELSQFAALKNTFIYDGRVLPFADGTFDYVYSTSVLEHMSHPAEVMGEVGRTLKSGGKFYLSFPNRLAPKETHTGLWFISWVPKAALPRSVREKLEDWNLHFIGYFRMKKMAKEAGLRILYNTKSRNIGKRLFKKLLASLGIHHRIFLKTIILVLEKP